MGKNKSKKAAKTEFQKHKSRMDKLAYKLEQEQEARKKGK